MNNIFDKADYVKRFVEKGEDENPVYSPMDPPDSYRPPAIDAVPYEELHPVLRLFTDEHKSTMEQLEVFEKTLQEIRSEGINKERNTKLGEFFQFLDDRIVLHNLKEERVLFPLLHDCLLEKGEHSTGEIPETAVDMLENDHIKMMQLVTLIFNMMGVSSRLTDPVSSAVLVDMAVEQGNSLVELLRLHIFREENVVFPLAQKYLSTDDFAGMVHKMNRYFSVQL
ncbi:MAG: hemerythrin domain-containing protein [Pedobacter sp.]|jgi:hemerythrin-like domain-containing protein